MLYAIKCNYILNLIFYHLKANLKLKLLKHNKELQDKLDINIENFKEYNYLFNMNNMFHLNINDINIEILSLSGQSLGNEILNYLNKINFSELKELDISENEISEINELKNAKFYKLEILNLGDNDITDISILEQVKFKKLKLLNLKENKISNISILEKVKFIELEELVLYSNKISNINVLENVDFNNLKYQLFKFTY